MNEYIKLWEQYFKVIDKLNSNERDLFCKFMNEASKPYIINGSDIAEEINRVEKALQR